MNMNVTHSTVWPPKANIPFSAHSNATTKHLHSHLNVIIKIGIHIKLQIRIRMQRYAFVNTPDIHTITIIINNETKLLLCYITILTLLLSACWDTYKMEDSCHHLPNGLYVIVGETNCFHGIIDCPEVTFVINCRHLGHTIDSYNYMSISELANLIQSPHILVNLQN